jgi:hypothetical protein
MRIAVDIDGVLANFSALMKFYNRGSGMLCLTIC